MTPMLITPCAWLTTLELPAARRPMLTRAKSVRSVTALATLTKPSLLNVAWSFSSTPNDPTRSPLPLLMPVVLLAV
ncbi:hypothetical protein D3C71_1639000 [compost metagenome]